MEISTGELTKENLFSSGRKNMVIEIGHGGPATIMIRKVREHLQGKDENYLGVDPNPDIMVDSPFFNEYKWSRNIVADITDLPESLDSSAEEIWVRNFKGMGLTTQNSRDLEVTIFNKISKLLKPGGQLVFIINAGYDFNVKKQSKDILGSMRKSNLEAEEIDPETTEHPFVNDLEEPTRNDVVIIATKPRSKQN